MKDYKLMTVGQIVADRFDHAKVFNKYGIDFCCNGDVSLTDACEEPEQGWTACWKSWGKRNRTILRFLILKVGLWIYW